MYTGFVERDGIFFENVFLGEYSLLLQKCCTFAVVKRWLAYIIPLLLCACQGNRVRQELYRIDSLNQCDVPLDTITTMDEVIDYLDLWGTPNERMTAHYLRGRVFHDQNNAPMALRYYRDAVGYADTTADDCDYRRLSRIYGQIAALFNRQHAPRLEIEAERKAIEYAWKAKDTLAAVIFYGTLCDPYHMLNDMDSVIAIISKLNSICANVNLENIGYSYGVTLADAYLRKKDYEKAKKALKEYELHSGFFDENGNIERGREIYYKFKGLYYDATGQKDSAEYCYRKLLHLSYDIDCATAAYHGLLSIYNQDANSDSIAKYANLYCQYNDSASFQHSADELTRTHALYNYEEHERIAAKKTQEANRYKNIIVVSFIAFGMIAYYCYRYSKKQQQRKKEELIAANREYISLLEQFKRLQDDMQLSQHDIDKFRKEKEQETQQLLQKLAHYQDAPQMSGHWDAEQAMLDSPLIYGLHQLASQAKSASKIQLKELREFIQKELPDFYAKIDSKEALLTPQEVYVCILIRLQFSQGELTALFDVSKQRMNNIKRNINKKLFHENGAQTLNDHIFSLNQM